MQYSYIFIVFNTCLDMADERGKIKRPYNYILPGYAAPVFVTFLLPFYRLF